MISRKMLGMAIWINQYAKETRFPFAVQVNYRCTGVFSTLGTDSILIGSHCMEFLDQKCRLQLWN